jgi:hypothetical protein
MTKGTQGRYNARRGGLVQLWHVEAAGGPERRGGERGQPDRRARATFDVESGAAPGDHAGGPGVRRVKEAVREFTVRVHGPQEFDYGVLLTREDLKSMSANEIVSAQSRLTIKQTPAT